jgi:hypothetical protein
MTLVRLLPLFFVVFSCNSASEKIIQQVEPPWGYVFDDWQGSPIDVITYIPPNATKNTPLLIVVPGASRDAQRFHASWLDLAKKNHFSVLTIGAKKSFFPDEYSYNAGGVITPSGELVDESKWLFAVIEPLFIDFKKRYGFTTKKFYLFGHSAGGGFVHRYLLFNPRAPIIKAVAANPAFVTLPDSDIRYPFGIKNAPISDKNIKSWVNMDLAIILGEDDLGPRTKPLSNGPDARAQGPNCLARGKLLYNETKRKAEELKANFMWELITVPGVGHDNYNLAPFASIYLFGDKEEK